jgi:alanine-synthesizing transaminase
MEFRRVDGLPPYVLGQIKHLVERRRAVGCDVVDFGFGNPDLPSPPLAVEKLAEAARNPRNHRYSASRGIPRLRSAIADRYQKVFGVELDPDTEVVHTIGAKEGLTHVMWVLLDREDTALVPSPSYPIHIFGPRFAGAHVVTVPMSDPGQLANGTPGDAFFDGMEAAWTREWPRPRVLVCSFPHNPTTACVDLAFMERLVAFALEHELIVVHDFAYADLGFDGYRPPSILQVPGAKSVAVELYTLTKSFSMAGWRVGFLVGNREIVGALTQLKTYLDYGSFQPIQIASIVALNEASDVPSQINAVYQQRRDRLIEGLERIGWSVPPPRGTMFVWAPIPAAYSHLSSLDFATLLVNEANVATAPGSGFGEGGEGFVRFALIENEARIAQAMKGIRRALPDLQAVASASQPPPPARATRSPASHGAPQT